MPTLEGLTLDNYNTCYQFFEPFWVQIVIKPTHNKWQIWPLKSPITTFTIIFGPFWLPIVMPILDPPKMQDLWDNNVTYYS